MANIPPIQFKRSTIPGTKPASVDLAVGELAINFPDGKIYTKDSDGLIVSVGSSGGSVKVYDSEQALVQHANSDSDIRKSKDTLFIIKNQNKLVTWDSDTDTFIQLGGGEGTVNYISPLHVGLRKAPPIDAKKGDAYRPSVSGLIDSEWGFDSEQYVSDQTLIIKGDSDEWFAIGAPENVVFKADVYDSFKESWHKGDENDIDVSTVTSVSNDEVTFFVNYNGRQVLCTATITENSAFNTAHQLAEAFQPDFVGGVTDFAVSANANATIEFVFAETVRMHVMQFRGRATLQWREAKLQTFADAGLSTPVTGGVENVVGGSAQIHTLFGDPNKEIQSMKLLLTGSTGNVPGLNELKIFLADKKISVPYNIGAAARITSTANYDHSRASAVTFAYGIAGFSHYVNPNPNTTGSQTQFVFLEEIPYDTRVANVTAMNEYDPGWGQHITEYNNNDATRTDRNTAIYYRDLANNLSDVDINSYNFVVHDYREVDRLSFVKHQVDEVILEWLEETLHDYEAHDSDDRVVRDSDWSYHMEEDSDWKAHYRLLSRVTFVDDVDPLPTTSGYYIFRTTRSANPELEAAFSTYEHGPGSQTAADAVKGAVFYYDQGTTTWEVYERFDRVSPTVATVNNITHSKVSNNSWSQMAKSVDNLTMTVDVLSDLTATLKDESPGYVYVNNEQEMYFWTATNDQSIRNGWSPFHPESISTRAEYDALNVGQYFTVREKFEGLPRVTTTYGWDTVRRFRDSVPTETTSTVQLKWDGKGGIAGGDGDVILNGSITSNFNSSFNLGRAFQSNGNDWCIGNGINGATLTLVPDATSGPFYPAHIGLYAQRSSGTEGFRNLQFLVEYEDGHIEYFSDTPDATSVESMIFPTYTESPCVKIEVYFYTEFGTNGGMRYFRLGFFEERTLTTTFIQPGSYLKTGSGGLDYKEAFPVNVSTGTRFIKTYATQADMIAGRVSDNHFEGGIYAVGPYPNGSKSYFEYTVPAIGTPTGTISDYNVVSSGREELIYPNEASLLTTTSQAEQKGGHWYFTDSKAYLYNGSPTGSINDYTIVTGQNHTDYRRSRQLRNQLFRPDDVTHYYRDIAQAETDGIVTVISNRNLNAHQGTNILRFDEVEIVIPAGTAMLHFGMLPDRDQIIAARYKDGNQEYIGTFSMGQDSALSLPGPFGNNDLGINQNYHGWISIAVSKCNYDRTLTIYKPNGSQTYITHLVFGSQNDWSWSQQHAYSVYQDVHASYGGTAVPTTTNGGQTLSKMWNNNNNNTGGQLSQANQNTWYGNYVTFTDTNDMLFWIHGRGDAVGDNKKESIPIRLRVNENEVDVLAWNPSVITTTEPTNPGREALVGFHNSWDNPMARMLNGMAAHSSYWAVEIPASFININDDGFGNAVPTPNLISMLTPVSDLNPTMFVRGWGTMKGWLDEYYVNLPTSP